jgi:hypothetical protein
MPDISKEQTAYDQFNLWNGPRQCEPYGAATIGSAEACMLAGLAQKWNWRRSRQKTGKDASRPNMVPGGNVQIGYPSEAAIRPNKHHGTGKSRRLFVLAGTRLPEPRIWNERLRKPLRASIQKT